MKNIAFTIGWYLWCLWNPGHTLAQPDTLWTGTFGGSGIDRGSSVQQTREGGFIIAGATDSYGAGNDDVYLIRTDASGQVQWSRTFGGGAWDLGYSVQQTSDGGYILAGKTGSFFTGNWDVYLIKTDSSGMEQWSQTFGGSALDEGTCVQQTRDGGYIIVGDTWSYGAGNDDFYLIKTDTSGVEQWSRTFGGSSFDFGSSIQQTNDLGYILVGTTASWGPGSWNVYLIKTDSLGIEQWSRTFGGTSENWGNSVQQTDDGGYIIAGGTLSYGAGNGDVYLVKTDITGLEQWSRTFGGTDWDLGNSVQQTSDNGYVIAGETISYGVGNNDVYLIKTDASGQEEWSQTIGGSAADNGYSVRQTSDHGYIIAGTTESYGAGNGDVWLIRLDNEVGVKPLNPEPAYAFRLLPPAPNPFNPTTVISFELRVPSLVKLEVFDINGRAVGARHAVPAKETWYPAGVHQITFDGGDLPSGLYFAKLTAGDFSQVQKLVLLK